MVVRSNPEFGIELALVIPYAYYLHTQGKLDTVITSRGMRPFYYFCDDVREDYKHRTIDNEAAGLNRLPNNWIHGIDSVGNPGVLDYKEWISPPYRNHYKNTEFTFDGLTGCSLRDNGDGVMQIVQQGSSVLTIVNKDIGTVDYTNGTVKLTNFEVSAFTGDGITVSANPVSKTLKSNKNIILSYNKTPSITIEQERI